MSTSRDDVGHLVELMKRKAPEILDLITASSDEEFEAAFDALLDRAIAHLETNKLNFQKLDEEGLTAALSGTLSMPGLSVTQETNSNGHVDITVEASYCMPARKKLGEAKIYDGPAYHFNGLQQLVGRYMTGREGRGLLIEYVRKQDIDGLMMKLRERMDAELPCSQHGPTADHVMKWCFLSNHAHSSGQDVEIGHISCNLYVEHGSPVPAARVKAEA